MFRIQAAADIQREEWKGMQIRMMTAAQSMSILLAHFATQALIDEVNTTPKPGLVDRRNNGAHRDMDLPMFERSARVLEPYFRDMVMEGMASDDCMQQLQQIGLAAETAMYRETGGVNTHKGGIFALGLLLAATGACYFRDGNIFERVRRLAGGIKVVPMYTHGAEVKRKYNKCGARSAALEGLPAAHYAYRLLSEEHLDGVSTLLYLMAELDDTNLLYRGGIEGLRFVQASAQEILAHPKELHAELAIALDNEMIRRNLSPGGCADMLAAGYYLKYTKAFWNTELNPQSVQIC